MSDQPAPPSDQPRKRGPKPKRKADTTAIMAEINSRIDRYDLLDDVAKQETRERARKHVEELRRKSQVDALFEQAAREENARLDPNEEPVTFTVELGDYAPFVLINGGMRYYHGVTYTVPVSLYRSLIDIMYQSQCHQREIDGKRRGGDLMRDPFGRGINQTGNTSLSMTTGAVTGRRAMTGNARI